MVRQASGSLSSRRWSKVNDVPGGRRPGWGVSAWSDGPRSLLMITALPLRGSHYIISEVARRRLGTTGGAAVAVWSPRGFRHASWPVPDRFGTGRLPPGRTVGSGVGGTG